jgi:hypothetical protein
VGRGISARLRSGKNFAGACGENVAWDKHWPNTKISIR